MVPFTFFDLHSINFFILLSYLIITRFGVIFCLCASGNFSANHFSCIRFEQVSYAYCGTWFFVRPSLSAVAKCPSTWFQTLSILHIITLAINRFSIETYRVCRGDKVPSKYPRELLFPYTLCPSPTTSVGAIWGEQNRLPFYYSGAPWIQGGTFQSLHKFPFYTSALFQSQPLHPMPSSVDPVGALYPNVAMLSLLQGYIIIIAYLQSYLWS